MPGKKGFTLIELLVVIAIIALLLSILIPSLRSAKEQAQGIVCVANLHSLGLTWVLYAEDNDGKLVGSYQGTRDMGLKLFPWACTMNTQNPPESEWEKPVWMDRKKQDIMDGWLWPYIKTLGTYKCLGDRSAHLRSYSISNSMSGTDHHARVCGTPAARKMSRIKNPSQRFVFAEENDYRFQIRGSYVVVVRGDYWWDFIPNWHTGKGNFAFADGHSEARKWRDRRTHEKAENQTLNDLMEDNPDLKWIQLAFNATGTFLEE